MSWVQAVAGEIRARKGWAAAGAAVGLAFGVWTTTPTELVVREAPPGQAATPTPAAGGTVGPVPRVKPLTQSMDDDRAARVEAALPPPGPESRQACATISVEAKRGDLTDTLYPRTVELLSQAAQDHGCARWYDQSWRLLATPKTTPPTAKPKPTTTAAPKPKTTAKPTPKPTKAPGTLEGMLKRTAPPPAQRGQAGQGQAGPGGAPPATREDGTPLSAAEQKAWELTYTDQTGGTGEAEDRAVCRRVFDSVLNEEYRKGRDKEAVANEAWELAGERVWGARDCGRFTTSRGNWTG